MEFDFEGMVAVVTGGAGGIGREIAAQYATHGAAVAIVDIDGELGPRIANDLTGGGCEARFFAADLSGPEDCRRAIDEAAGLFGRVDILINCAGLGRGASPYDLAVEDWDYVLNVNLRAAFLCARTAAAYMKKNDGGSIVNIASTRALMSEPNTEAYSASKGGLLALTHALAMSLAPDRIRVNSISPGWICTDGYDALSKADHAQHPSGRVGRPVDIARACLYLTDAGNDFITGENIVIDGGMTRKMIYVE